MEANSQVGVLAFNEAGAVTWRAAVYGYRPHHMLGPCGHSRGGGGRWYTVVVVVGTKEMMGRRLVHGCPILVALSGKVLRYKKKNSIGMTSKITLKMQWKKNPD